MSHPQTPMQIFQLLDGSDCGSCGESTCMAFAAAVFRGQRSLSECPRVEESAASSAEEGDRAANAAEMSEREMAQRLRGLQEEVAGLDLAAAANRLGGSFQGGLLHIPVLGWDFAVDQQGRFYTRIHTNYWITVPVLDYVLHASGAEPTGQWKPLRELDQGMSWNGLFRQRCEKPLKALADDDPELFRELLDIFGGVPPQSGAEADISAVLYPLPKVPVLIAYWHPEEDMGSHLNVLFDSTADKNLSMASVFAMGTGLGRMFEKIHHKHTPGLRE